MKINLYLESNNHTGSTPTVKITGQHEFKLIRKQYVTLQQAISRFNLHVVDLTLRGIMSMIIKQ